MGFARAGRPSASISPGTPADENNTIAFRRRRSTHLVLRRRAANRPDFETFGHIAGMIDLIDESRGKADLIPVGGKPVSCPSRNASLWKLTEPRFRYRSTGVSAAGDPCRLIHIATLRQRVSNGASEARSRAPVWLDLRGMIMRLVFQHEEPGLTARSRNAK